MERKSNTFLLIILILLGFVIGSIAYNQGRKTALKESLEKQQFLQQLNRDSIEKLDVEDGKTIYVIGHKSPDSDTVISAIAYARLLNMLGYDAQARISEPINKETAYILKQADVEVPEELLDASAENIFLVDHSEYAQSIEGMQDAHIVGILDHHGVGTVSTGNQVLFEAKPIGSTATIIWIDYLNYGLEIDKTTAHILLGALLSDTTNLTVTSTTKADILAKQELSKLALIDDPDQFYLELHKEALSYEGMSNEEILFYDYKEYEASGIKYGIGLVNSIDEQSSKLLAEKMKDALSTGFSSKEVDLMYASVGIRENNQKIDYIIPANELSESILKNAFPDYDEYDGTSYIYRSGLGRKSKFVPGLNDYLASHPHD